MDMNDFFWNSKFSNEKFRILKIENFLFCIFIFIATFAIYNH